MRRLLISCLLCLPLGSAQAWFHHGGVVQPVQGTTFVIVLQYQPNALAAPQSFRNYCQTAANILMTTILDTATVYMRVEYGAFFGTPLTMEGETAIENAVTVSYTNLYAAYSSHAAGPDHAAAVASLPNASTIDGRGSFSIPSAQGKVLGLMSATDPTLDSATGIGSSISNSDLLGVILHEFTHGLGRTVDSPATWFRFTAVNTRYYGTTPPFPTNYFTLDDGATSIAAMSTTDGGSFDNSITYQGLLDPFDTNYAFNGTYQNLTPLDIRMLNVIGFRIQ